MTNGERWIRLLRSYSPVADNEAMQAEHVDKLAADLEIPKLAFEHPARADVMACFPCDTGDFKNVVLTGTAGDGKTSLCIDIVRELAQGDGSGEHGMIRISVPTQAGMRTLTLIYDVTAWKSASTLRPEQIELLRRMANSVYGAASDDFFVLAVNDGQLHELFRAIPPGADQQIDRLRGDLISLHANGGRDYQRLRLLNLSHIPSEDIMRRCLEALLDRDEWQCFENEQTNPLFRINSSLRRNHAALGAPEIREKLVMLARIADATGHHLPVRGVLCLLTNSLLGHPKARDRLIRPGVENDLAVDPNELHLAAFHRNLFGDNLTRGARNKRSVYRFLAMLHVGEETTNDLDELIVFGARDPELRAAHQALVEVDQFKQHNPHFDGLLIQYIRGDIVDEERTQEFLAALSAERRRIFLQATAAQLAEHNLWQTTTFHYAGVYLNDILGPLSSGKKPSRSNLSKLASGLNRVWTGLLLSDDVDEVYYASGLDLTAAPISDLFLGQAELEGEPPGMEVVRQPHQTVPDLVLHANGKTFSFPLTLQRFEFLRRVAEGTMPSSFSREASSDFMSLKQRCLRDLALRTSPTTMHLLDVRDTGTIYKRAIYFTE